MRQLTPRIASLVAATVFSVVSAQAVAGKNITLMQLGDVHGHMHEHTER